MDKSIVLALVTTLCYGVNDVLWRIAAQRGAPSHQMLMTGTATMAPLMYLYALGTGSVGTHPSAWWGAIGGIFSFAGFFLFYQSLKHGAVSVAAPVFRLQFIVSALLAIAILGESASVLKILAFLSALGAIWLLLIGSSVSLSTIPGHALTRLLVATVTIGVAFFLFKLALVGGAPPGTVLVHQVTTLSISAALASYLIDRGFKAHPVALRIGLITGVIQVVGFASFIEALARNEVTVIQPIAQLSFVVAAVIGFIALKEQVTARKIAGLVLAVAAVALLSRAASAT